MSGVYGQDPNLHWDPVRRRWYRHNPYTNESVYLEEPEDEPLNRRGSEATPRAFDRRRESDQRQSRPRLDSAGSTSATAPYGLETAFENFSLDEPDYVLSAQASANAVAPDVTGVDYETAQQNADPDVPINKVRAKVFAPKGNKQTLDPRFVKQRDPKEFFTPGRVIKILWPEPAGNIDNKTTVTVISRRFHDIRIYEKIRWFVVVKAGYDSCICIPIATYEKRGVAKRGVLKRHHCIVYTTRRPPGELKGEEPSNRKEKPMLPPLHVIPTLQGDYMEKESRLNFGKMYTVEHNVRVYDFGMVDPKQIRQLVSQWRKIIIEPDAGPAPPQPSHPNVPNSIYVDLGESNMDYTPPSGDTRQIALRIRDRLSVLEWPYDDWAYAYNTRTRQTGLVSIQYIHLYETAIARYDYQNTEETRGYVTIQRGDELRLIEARPDGWSLVWKQETAETGLVPSNYIEKQE